MTVVDFPFGTSAAPGTSGTFPIWGTPYVIAYGSVTVAADGGANAPVTFTTPFANALLIPPILGVNSGLTPSAAGLYAPESYAQTLAGFSIYLAGGAPGTTALVSYIAIGY